MRYSTLVMAAFLTLAINVGEAGAAYPERQVRLVVSLAPGGSVDTVARLVAAKLSEKWGQPVVVDNRPGADGTIADQIVSMSNPDGYTLLFASGEHDVTPVLNDLPYDSVSSFIPVIRVTNTPVILAVNAKDVPVKNMTELLAYARANPGKLNYGHGGIGTPPNLAMLLLMKETGVNIVPVQFKGMAPALVSLLGGEIQMMMGTITVILPHVAAGTLVPLAGSTPTRARKLPDVPTVAEAANLPGFDVGSWTGIFAPIKTPESVVAKVNGDIQSVLALPEVQKTLADQDFDIIGGSPAEFAKFVAADVAKWRATFPSKAPGQNAPRP